jgi:hypothetical protein
VPIYSFSPLRSFRRIIVTFYDIPSATTIRKQLDGSIVMDQRVRIYFGAHTDVSPTTQHLAAPKVDKLFFISPPPSPPHGWAVRNEGAPNKTVHAEDLAEALARLHARSHADCDGPQDATMADAPATTLSRAGSQTSGRLRSSSVTVVYTPELHGGRHPSLPAISVEDTEFVESPREEDELAMEGVELEPAFVDRRTPRPPVELMQY